MTPHIWIDFCIFHQITFRQGAVILDAIRQGAAILHGPVENVFPTKVRTLDSFAGGAKLRSTCIQSKNILAQQGMLLLLKFHFPNSGGSRISQRGHRPRKGGGGGVDSRGSYVSKNLYVETNESGPLGKGMRRARPPGSANANYIFSLVHSRQFKWKCFLVEHTHLPI